MAIIRLAPAPFRYRRARRETTRASTKASANFAKTRVRRVQSASSPPREQTASSSSLPRDDLEDQTASSPPREQTSSSSSLPRDGLEDQTASSLPRDDLENQTASSPPRYHLPTVPRRIPLQPVPSTSLPRRIPLRPVPSSSATGNPVPVPSTSTSTDPWSALFTPSIDPLYGITFQPAPPPQGTKERLFRAAPFLRPRRSKFFKQLFE